MTVDKIIPCAVLGATGTVGQKFILLLRNHPIFKITSLGASGKSVGKYGDVVQWKQTEAIPEDIASMTVSPCVAEAFRSCPVIFSALPTDIATSLEMELALLGKYVFSNAASHRMDKDVPILLPMINGSHLSLIMTQPAFRKSRGFIVANSNCACAGLTTALSVIDKISPVESVTAATLQAVSGAGYPGLPVLDLLGNIVPFINGEEEKTELETPKILGQLKEGVIENHPLKVTTMVHRVPVLDGHTVSISVKTASPITPEEAIKAFSEHKQKDPLLDMCPSAPKKMVLYKEESDRPQPRLDLNTGDGFTTCIGRIRGCNVNTLRVVTLAHNTVIGAAGGSLLNAEYAWAAGYIVNK